MAENKLFEQIDKLVSNYQGCEEPLILMLSNSLYSLLAAIKSDRISINEGDYYIDGKIKVVKG